MNCLKSDNSDREHTAMLIHRESGKKMIRQWSYCLHCNQPITRCKYVSGKTSRWEVVR